MPEVCSSKSSILRGRRSGTRSSTGWPESSFLSMPTRMPAKEGMYLLTGSSRAIFPRSSSIIAATLVMVLLTEWIGKIVSAVIGVPFSTSRLPKHLKNTGWPWCWIRTMAPGMLPEAISPLIKSSMAESFSRDSTACGGGPSSAAATDSEAESETAATAAAAVLDNATFRQIICRPTVWTGRGYCIPVIRSRQQDEKRPALLRDRHLATGPQSSRGVFPPPCCVGARGDAAHENADPEFAEAPGKAGLPLCSAPPRKRKSPWRPCRLPRLTGRPHSREIPAARADCSARYQNRSVPARRPSACRSPALAKPTRCPQVRPASRAPARPTDVRVRPPRAFGRGQRAGLPARDPPPHLRRSQVRQCPHGWLPRPGRCCRWRGGYRCGDRPGGMQRDDGAARSWRWSGSPARQAFRAPGHQARTAPARPILRAPERHAPRRERACPPE